MEQNTGEQISANAPAPDAQAARQAGEHIRKNFASDNVAPVCPEILAAIGEANVGAAPSYGADPWTAGLKARVAEIFETDAAVFPVTTGTASNGLALSALCPPWGAVLCDESAHIDNEECGAPEFYTHGAKLRPLPSADGRIDPALLARALNGHADRGFHLSKLSALSVTQATEWGATYSLEHLREVTDLARGAGLGVHMDGARFSNALAHLGCSPADMTWRAGVDILSLGATKNGALAAEALIVFDPVRAVEMERRIKRAGHVWSKQRFLSAQLLAWFADDLWLRNARNANDMASRLARGLLRQPGATLPYAIESNEVFVVLPEPLVQGLEQAGYDFYRWTTPPGVEGVLIRLVTRYDTTPDDIDGLLASLSAVA
ncbi:low-specificity threonine aldolase [Acetobacter nitrogenifigens DSM 23921 = NBRC 105050]|uniref:L-threonine aldolase n=1 Tax=Acetobacter nitrogenifigens DSM 23921 = NBRC 105050 TaxID=1120919 RepID=A0A511X7C2_9PROT|nr:low specificity L-threonine aldolase [Acetobacter nitrogenifigens]GBQ95461.1 low-specificity threonine aldolase [Acetobacter nitrogenifigens DSM 23921 = NBRC 105050]GEN58832.1 L-threonine aldolase [Acetobacter nitrogenifigens DSM 23921 = NBRC 105050]